MRAWLRRWWIALPASALLGAAVVTPFALDGSKPTLAVAPSASAPGPDFGAHTCTTNSAGYCANQAHGLGVQPVAVVATVSAPIAGTAAAAIDADSFTATTFRVRVFGTNGAAFASKTVTYSYAAWAAEPEPTTQPPTTTPPSTTTAPATTTPAPITTTPAPTPTDTTPADIWPAPGSVGLQTTTTANFAGGRFAESGDFGAPWTGSGTQADPFVLDRKHVTGGLVFGCGCGSHALDSVYVMLSNDWLAGPTGNPTPESSRFVFIEDDGPHVTISHSNVQPDGTLDASGIRTDNHCVDNAVLSYRPLTVRDSRVSGGAVLVRIETERNEGQTLIEHNDLRGICSNAGDHTDVYNENGHGSHAVINANYIDGTRSGGSVVNNGLGLYDDNINQCDSCATTEDHTITNNRFVHYNIGVLSGTATNRILGPWVVTGNVFDSPTALGPSPGLPYDARTPTSQSDNSVNGSPVTF